MLLLNNFFFQKAAEVPIGSLAVSGKTKWEILDNIVRKIFKVRSACIKTISEKQCPFITLCLVMF